VNLIASIPSFSSFFVQNNQTQTIDTGGLVRLGFSDNVDVFVVKKRSLWKTHQINEDFYIYLLYLIKLPLKVKGFNYSYVHIAFSVIIAFFIFREYKKKQRKAIMDPYEEQLIQQTQNPPKDLNSLNNLKDGQW
jgi:hypothetical protein